MDKKILVQITNLSMYLHAYTYYEDDPDTELDIDSTKFLYSWKRLYPKYDVQKQCTIYIEEMVPTFKNTILAEEGFTYEVTII